MGTKGSGRFSDYPGSRSSGEGQGAGGGASGEDRCNRAFTCYLEEVEQCEYFSQTQSVPAVNTALTLELRGRLFAVDSEGSAVGALPTRFNHLADCMSAGYSYEGRVVSSATSPMASVNVDFAPRGP